MLDKLDWAEFVLLICTKGYYRRFRGHEDPDKGKGVDWEGQLIALEIYHAKSRTTQLNLCLSSLALKTKSSFLSRFQIMSTV
jgi:hypothetical protein